MMEALGGHSQEDSNGLIDSGEEEPTPGALMEGSSKPYSNESAAEIQRLRHLLERSEEKNRKLERKYARAKIVFKDLWDRRMTKRKELRMAKQMLKNELALWRSHQKELQGTVEDLKQALGEECGKVGVKLREIQRLSGKVEELGWGEVKVNQLNEMDEEGGHHMTAVTDMERKSAADIFPEELWIMILGNISDPKDLWNLCNTCQLFDDILCKWKTGWLLGQAIPYLYKDLPGTRLLECRRICKSWRVAVDAFLETHASLRPHDPDSSDPRRLDFVNPLKEKEIGGSYAISFSSHTNMSLFEDPNFLENWKRNHIIGRSIVLKLGRDYDLDDRQCREDTQKNERVDSGFHRAWEKFYKFLSSFGKEVWHLSICYFINRSDGADTWEGKVLPFLTTDLFQIFPNLRKLHIQDRHYTFDGVINPESLPPAPKLETLGSACWDGEIGKAMLTRYQYQLRKLHLTNSTWKTVRQLEWPNLSELYLIHFLEPEDFQVLYGVKMSQLTKLGMHVGEFNDNSNNIDILLNVLREVLSTTRLITLRLEGGLHGFFYDESQCQTESRWESLSKVKTLEFEHCTWRLQKSAPMYDFSLRYFPLLENLNLFVMREQEDDFEDISMSTEDLENNAPIPYDPFSSIGTEMSLLPYATCKAKKKPLKLGMEQEIVEVNNYIYDGAMYRSNIWELMPLLKVFTFQWDIYTREVYEERMNKLRKKENCLV